MQQFPGGNIYCCFSLIVPRLSPDSCLHQDPSQFPLPHGCRNMKSCVTVFVLSRHFALGANQNTCDTRMSVPCCRVKWRVSVLINIQWLVLGNVTLTVAYIIFDVRSAAIDEQHPTRLVMTILACHVKCSEPAPVLDVNIGAVVTQHGDSLTEPVLCCQVESCNTINFILMVHSSSSIKQNTDNVDMSTGCCQLQGRPSSLKNGFHWMKWTMNNSWYLDSR